MVAIWVQAGPIEHPPVGRGGVHHYKWANMIARGHATQKQQEGFPWKIDKVSSKSRFDRTPQNKKRIKSFDPFVNWKLSKVGLLAVIPAR